VSSLACNAMLDHVHLFVRLLPTMCVATFIGEIKGVASHTHNHRFGARHHLKWQDGYGVVTVREAEADKVIRYIVNQQELHANRKTLRLLEQVQEVAQSNVPSPGQSLQQPRSRGF